MFQNIQNNVQDEGKPLDLSEDCALLHCTEVKKLFFTQIAITASLSYHHHHQILIK